MKITLHTATRASLGEVLEAITGWQQEGGPVQLHPGDLGWAWRLGAEALAGALRVWRRDGHILAAGLLEDAGLIRMGLAPSVEHDDAFAAQLLADISGRARGVLDCNDLAVEARFGTAFRELLTRSGWLPDEPWTPLRRTLADPVEGCSLRIQVIDARTAPDRIAVQRSAFTNSTFTLQRWHWMAEAPPYRRGRCLVGYDRNGDAVAAATLWSAGPGRPGLIEPLGVHRDHRGHGYGTAITLASAAALQELGSSSATVCTPTGNVGAVQTYASAGFQILPEVSDFRRSSG